MKIRITPKDSVGEESKFELDVKCWYPAYGTFQLVLEDGTIRVYPMEHIWYMEVL